jgi:exopolyphosphatase/guanosine-5'-triphosphate,3'-diphosphate pyrophosphatase
MRVATIDIGTNSVLLLIAEGPPQQLRAVVDRSTITRLGQGVDKTRALHPDAVDRTLQCLREYAAALQQHAVDRLAVVATSASRDADGAEAFVRQAEQLLGVAPVVISGDREAELTFRGALSGLPVEGQVALQDVGGGSTEIVVGTVKDAVAQVKGATSLDIGSVRMTERFLRADPPDAEQLEQATAHVRAELARAPVAEGPVSWVGVAGTITTLAAVQLGCEPYDAAVVHGSCLTLAQVQALLQRLAALPAAQRRAVPGLEPKRADVIVGGALIVAEVLRRAGAEQMLVSDRGVRWGLAQEIAASP